jgi:predicted DNA-binding transcriptional regulator AlpA
MPKESKELKSKNLLTLGQVAKRFNCVTRTIWRCVERGDLVPPMKIAGLTRWRESDIDEMIANAPTAKTAHAKKPVAK